MASPVINADNCLSVTQASIPETVTCGSEKIVACYYNFQISLHDAVFGALDHKYLDNAGYNRARAPFARAETLFCRGVASAELRRRSWRSDSACSKIELGTTKAGVSTPG